MSSPATGEHTGGAPPGVTAADENPMHRGRGEGGKERHVGGEPGPGLDSSMRPGNGEKYRPRKTGDGVTGDVVATTKNINRMQKMDSVNPAERLVNSVPYCRNSEANKLLREHFENSPHSDKRFYLVCNTGPRGVGKTTLQCQNMLWMAKQGCLSIFIDFNGEQPIHERECDLEFKARVALRIEWYCRERRDNDPTDFQFSDFVGRMFAEGATTAAIGEMTIGESVRKLKKLLNHKGPVFLAVDELRLSNENSDRVMYNLNVLCRAMDDALKKGKTEDSDDRIFLAVSVYDIVSLQKMSTGSSRRLLLQPTPPVFPLWVWQSDTDSEMDPETLKQLPKEIQIFFNEEARTQFWYDSSDKDAVESLITQVGKLLFATGGHGRRVENLMDRFTQLQRENKQLRHLAPDEVKEWAEKATAGMDRELHLSDDISSSLVSCSLERENPANFLTHLLEKLFCPGRIDSDSPQDPGMSMRLATVYHYGVLSDSGKSIGYLPLQSVSGLCKEIEQSGRHAITELMKTQLFKFVRKLAADAESLSLDKNKTQRKNKDAKKFEQVMMRTLCAALLSGRCGERFSELFHRGNRETISIPYRLESIEVLDDVEAFPCIFNGRRTTTTGILGPDDLLPKILAIGGGEGKTGLAFLPTDTFNLCCDFVLVLPKRDGGRYLMLFQCKHWFPHAVEGEYAFDAFRYGRQFVEQKFVFLNKTGRRDSVRNPAFEKFEDLKEKNTTICFVLLTVNAAPVNPSRGPVTMYNNLSNINVPENDRLDTLRHDEWLMDLAHMRKWCPTMAYSTLMALKVRDVLVSHSQSSSQLEADATGFVE